MWELVPVKQVVSKLRSIAWVMVRYVQVGAARTLPGSCEVLQTLTSLKAHALPQGTRVSSQL